MTSVQHGYGPYAVGMLTQSIRMGGRGRESPAVALSRESPRAPVSCRWAIAKDAVRSWRPQRLTGRLAISGGLLQPRLSWSCAGQQPGGGAHRAPAGVASSQTALRLINREGFVGGRVQVNQVFEGPPENSFSLQSRPSLSKHWPGFLTLSASLRPSYFTKKCVSN